MKYSLLILIFSIVLCVIIQSVRPDGIFSFNIRENTQNEENSENICPNNHTKCADKQTCCKTKHNSYHCCQYPNAVCCPDKYHCCPHGSACDTVKKRCRKQKEMSKFTVKSRFEPMKIKFIYETIKIENNEKMCLNNRTKCKNSQTCCASKHDNYVCCKFENAICCSDKYCCPVDSVCDLKHQKCIKFSIKTKKLILKERNIEMKSEIVCPNNKTKCKDTKTCCITKHDNYYCCPHKNAVCCSDKYQCCPAGTTCDIENKKCINSSFGLSTDKHDIDIEQFHLESPVEIESLNFSFSENRLGKGCLDQKYRCPGKKRCCELYTGNFGCCAFNAGVCCPDLRTCCPHETVCDGKNKICSAVPLKLFPISTKRTQRLTTVVCPDNITECFSWETCCPVEDNSYGCCPIINATCCADKSTCCRHNQKCDVKNGTCQKLITNLMERNQIKSKIKISGPSKLKKYQSNNDYCLSSHTFCEFGNNQNHCCPYTSGVCCPDSQTCCPNGTKCVANGCAHVILTI